jgi:hypothetical protein
VLPLLLLLLLETFSSCTLCPCGWQHQLQRIAV